MWLTVQPHMTTHPDTQNDLQDLEAQFRTELVLSPEAQDLLFREARTANTFTDEPVSEEQVRAIYDLAKWAPTSMNNQPLRIVLVRSPEARGRLVETWPAATRPRPSTAPLVAVLAADLDFHEEFPRTFPHFPGARDVFAADAAMRAESATLQRHAAGGLLHPGRPRRGAGRRPDDRLRRRGVSTEFFPDGGAPRSWPWSTSASRASRLDGPRCRALTTTRSSRPSEPSGPHLLGGVRGAPEPPSRRRRPRPARPSLPLAGRRAGRFLVPRANATVFALGDTGCRATFATYGAGTQEGRWSA